MHIRALSSLFLPDQERYVDPGEVVEVEDARGKRAVELGVAEQVTAAEAKKVAKQDGEG